MLPRAAENTLVRANGLRQHVQVALLMLNLNVDNDVLEEILYKICNRLHMYILSSIF